MKKTVIGMMIIGMLFLASAWNFEGKGGSISTTTWTGNLTKFTQLTDVPNSYTGEAGNCAIVNAGETAIEFGACSSSTSTYNATYASWAYNQTTAVNTLYGKWFYNMSSSSAESDPIWNANYSIFAGLINNASYLATYNTTYDLYSYNHTSATNTLYGKWFYNMSDGTGNTNASFNQSLTDLLYANIKWGYNMTYSGSTYNITYNKWAYNQTYSGSTYNETYASWLPNWTASSKYWYNMTSSSAGTYNATYDLWSYNHTTISKTYTDSVAYNKSANINTGNYNLTLGDNKYICLGDSGCADSYITFNGSSIIIKVN